MSDDNTQPNMNREPDPLPWEFAGNIPEGDNPDVTRHLAESTVGKLATTLREIVEMTDVFADMAPGTTTRVYELLSITSGELLAWIRRWQA
ncbi:hypothetical protein V7968_16325 [Nocardia vulneris]|uniref:hypothetical protein n=1 Tax=Nocardia vulneris TaxID=1141657 RepID=UPI0030D0B6BB